MAKESRTTFGFDLNPTGICSWPLNLPHGDLIILLSVYHEVDNTLTVKQISGAKLVARSTGMALRSSLQDIFFSNFINKMCIFNVYEPV